MKKKKASRGGKREGAGRTRKYEERVITSVSMPADLRDAIDAWAVKHEMNRSEAIVEAMRRLTKSRR